MHHTKCNFIVLEAVLEFDDNFVNCDTLIKIKSCRPSDNLASVYEYRFTNMISFGGEKEDADLTLPCVQ